MNPFLLPVGLPMVLLPRKARRDELPLLLPGTDFSPAWLLCNTHVYEMGRELVKISNHLFNFQRILEIAFMAPG